MIKKLLLLFLLIPTALQAQKSMNEARAEIRVLLSSTNTETRFFTDVQVDSAWVRAIRIVALKAEVIVQKSDSFTTAIGQYRYLLAATTFRVRTAWKRKGSDLRLLFITNDPYLNVRAGWSMPAEFAYLHSGASGFELKLIPTPSAVESVYYDYYARPVVPTTAGGATDLPQELLPALLYEAAAYLVNADYRHNVSAQYHAIAMDLAATYKNSFLSQGNLPLPAGGSTEK